MFSLTEEKVLTKWKEWVYNGHNSKGNTNNDKGQRPGGKVMYTFKVTFQNEETGKRKNFKIEERGMIPAIEKSVHVALQKGLGLEWVIKKVEEI